jgi:hypothetical protein
MAADENPEFDDEDEFDDDGAAAEAADDSFRDLRDAMWPHGPETFAGFCFFADTEFGEYNFLDRNDRFVDFDYHSSMVTDWPAEEGWPPRIHSDLFDRDPLLGVECELFEYQCYVNYESLCRNLMQNVHAGPLIMNSLDVYAVMLRIDDDHGCNHRGSYASSSWLSEPLEPFQEEVLGIPHDFFWDNYAQHFSPPRITLSSACRCPSDDAIRILETFPEYRDYASMALNPRPEVIRMVGNHLKSLFDRMLLHRRAAVYQMDYLETILIHLFLKNGHHRSAIPNREIVQLSRELFSMLAFHTRSLVEDHHHQTAHAAAATAAADRLEDCLGCLLVRLETESMTEFLTYIRRGFLTEMAAFMEDHELLSSEKDAVALDHPVLFLSEKHFTVFWKFLAMNPGDHARQIFRAFPEMIQWPVWAANPGMADWITEKRDLTEFGVDPSVATRFIDLLTAGNENAADPNAWKPLHCNPSEDVLEYLLTKHGPHVNYLWLSQQWKTRNDRRILDVLERNSDLCEFDRLRIRKFAIRVAARTRLLKEELVQKAFHPRRIARMLFVQNENQPKADDDDSGDELDVADL